MERLGQADLEHVLWFLGELASTETEEPFPRELLAGLRRLVPCDWVGFCELDRVRKLELGLIDDPSWPGDDPACDYWQIRHEHPVCHYHEVSGDFRALKLSDFVNRHELHASRVYSEWFRPAGVEHEMSMGLDAPLSHTKVFLFDRFSGGDFTERDRAVLDLLRPHLARRYAESHARRRASKALALLDGNHHAVVLIEHPDQIALATDHAHELLVRYFGDNGARLPKAVGSWLESECDPGGVLEVRRTATLVIRRAGEALLLEEHPLSPPLTPRQQQILELVADGHTNAEIAAALCLAAGTVRRHLENIFGKLGVHNRTAAVAALRRDRAPS